MTSSRSHDDPIRLVTSRSGQTQALAATVAASLRPGDVVALTGDLGAGKTCFVQGAAAELGVEQRVVSPTYIIVRTYDAHLPASGEPVMLVHVDVYRLERLQEMVELGEDTLMGDDQITFIEWGDTVGALLPTDRLEVELSFGEGVDDRRLCLRGYGDWTDRLLDVYPDLVDWQPDQED